MKLYFDDAEFDQQLHRTFANAPSRMCDGGPPARSEMFKNVDGSGGHCEGMGQTRYYAGVFSFATEHLAS